MLIIFWYKGNELWKVLFDVSRLNIFKNNRFIKHLKIIDDCEECVVKISNIFFTVFLTICLQWILYPLLIYLCAFNERKNDRLCLNALNFRFPKSIDTNNHYIIFYTFESAVIFITVYVTKLNNIYVISLICITVSHYKILYRGFENIRHDSDTQIAGKY